MAFDTIGDNLIVMHSFLGIFEVDLITGQKKQLVTESDVIGDEVRSRLTHLSSETLFDFLLEPSNLQNLQLSCCSTKRRSLLLALIFRVRHRQSCNDCYSQSIWTINSLLAQE